RLADAGYFVTLDFLGESVASRDEARAAADTYLRMLDGIAGETLTNGQPMRTRVNVSLKLTQMGQDIEAPAGQAPWSGPVWPKPAQGMTPEEGRYDYVFLREN